MRIIILALGLLISAVTAANPNVGDYAILQGNYNGQIATLKTQYTEFANGQMLKTDEFSMAGQISIAEELIAPDDIVTKETLALTMALCETMLGGTIELLKTPVGELNTCKVKGEQAKGISGVLNFEKQDQAWVWIAEIPVAGIAKVSANGMDFIIQEYSWAQ